MARTFDSRQNPLSKMNVLRAYRWGIDAWESSVMPSTIQNCWSRSQAIDFGARPIGNNLWSDSRALLERIQIDIQALQDQGRIRKAMNIH